jgi:hypothetical protein
MYRNGKYCRIPELTENSGTPRKYLHARMKKLSLREKSNQL